MSLSGVLQPRHVSRFFVNAARPPIFEWTTVFVLVWSPSTIARIIGCYLSGRSIKLCLGESE